MRAKTLESRPLSRAAPLLRYAVVATISFNCLEAPETQHLQGQNDILAMACGHLDVGGSLAAARAQAYPEHGRKMHHGHQCFFSAYVYQGHSSALRALDWTG